MEFIFQSVKPVQFLHQSRTLGIQCAKLGDEFVSLRFPAQFDHPANVTAGGLVVVATHDAFQIFQNLISVQIHDFVGIGFGQITFITLYGGKFWIFLDQLPKFVPLFLFDVYVGNQSLVIIALGRKNRNYSKQNSSSSCFSLQFLIKLHLRHFHPRRNPKQANAEGEDSQKNPADETEVEHEKIHLVALHQGFAASEALAGAEFWVVFGNVGRHAEGVGLDDARNDKQKAPKQDINRA